MAPTKRRIWLVDVLRSAKWILFPCVFAVLTSCSDRIAAPVLPDTVYVTVVSGNFQVGANGEQLAEPVVVRIESEDHSPVPGVQVDFEILSGGGVLEPSSTATDSSGAADVQWALGFKPYPILKASVVDSAFWAATAYIHANTEIAIENRWITGVAFPRPFGSNVGHDGRLLESNDFVLFSDECGDDMKIVFSRMAEEVFHQVLQVFGFASSAELGISASNARSKVTIFYNSHTDFPYGAFAFNTGYVMPAINAASFLQISDRQLDYYERTMKHETVHLFQFLMGLDNLPLLWPDVWFSEGLAVHISDNVQVIDDVPALNEWRAVDGNDNPIAIHDWPDLPIPESQGGRYYPVFGLAVRYLLDEDGYGKTLDDVRNLYGRMASSRNGFGEAFEMFVGMSLRYYEDNFFDLVQSYLSRLAAESRGPASNGSNILPW